MPLSDLAVSRTEADDTTLAAQYHAAHPDGQLTTGALWDFWYHRHSSQERAPPRLSATALRGLLNDFAHTRWGVARRIFTVAQCSPARGDDSLLRTVADCAPAEHAAEEGVSYARFLEVLCQLALQSLADDSDPETAASPGPVVDASIAVAGFVSLLRAVVSAPEFGYVEQYAGLSTEEMAQLSISWQQAQWPQWWQVPWTVCLPSPSTPHSWIARPSPMQTVQEDTALTADELLHSPVPWSASRFEDAREFDQQATEAFGRGEHRKAATLWEKAVLVGSPLASTSSPAPSPHPAPPEPMQRAEEDYSGSAPSPHFVFETRHDLVPPHSDLELFEDGDHSDDITAVGATPAAIEAVGSESELASAMPLSEQERGALEVLHACWGTRESLMVLQGFEAMLEASHLLPGTAPRGSGSNLASINPVEMRRCFLLATQHSRGSERAANVEQMVKALRLVATKVPELPWHTLLRRLLPANSSPHNTRKTKRDPSQTPEDDDVRGEVSVAATREARLQMQEACQEVLARLELSRAAPVEERLVRRFIKCCGMDPAMAARRVEAYSTFRESLKASHVKKDRLPFQASWHRTDRTGRPVLILRPNHKAVESSHPPRLGSTRHVARSQDGGGQSDGGYGRARTPELRQSARRCSGARCGPFGSLRVGDAPPEVQGVRRGA